MVVYNMLEQTPGALAFAQAINLVERCLKEQGVSEPEKVIRYSVNPNLSFPPGDIESIHFTEKDGHPYVEIMLNLMGLHGSSSPMPTYFTEFIAQNQDVPNALQDFFDIFNHRLITILYRAWNKYRYHLRYKYGATDEISRRFLSFIGLGHRSVQQSTNLDLSTLLSYAGLISSKGDSYDSVENTLRYYFNHQYIGIIPCIKRNVRIHREQIAKLGLANTVLDENFMLGSEVCDQNGKFRIHIYNLYLVTFNSFLPDKEKFKNLKKLVNFIFLSHITFDIELVLKKEEIPQWMLGVSSGNRLGWSTWLGTNGDGIVLLETNHQEV
jgi:type VI secretion system protein ImpH